MPLPPETPHLSPRAVEVAPGKPVPPDLSLRVVEVASGDRNGAAILGLPAIHRHPFEVGAS